MVIAWLPSARLDCLHSVYGHDSFTKLLLFSPRHFLLQVPLLRCIESRCRDVLQQSRWGLMKLHCPPSHLLFSVETSIHSFGRGSFRYLSLGTYLFSDFTQCGARSKVAGGKSRETWFIRTKTNLQPFHVGTHLLRRNIPMRGGFSNTARRCWFFCRFVHNITALGCWKLLAAITNFRKVRSTMCFSTNWVIYGGSPHTHERLLLHLCVNTLEPNGTGNYRPALTSLPFPTKVRTVGAKPRNPRV